MAFNYKDFWAQLEKDTGIKEPGQAQKRQDSFWAQLEKDTGIKRPGAQSAKNTTASKGDFAAAFPGSQKNKQEAFDYDYYYNNTAADRGYSTTLSDWKRQRIGVGLGATAPSQQSKTVNFAMAPTKPLTEADQKAAAAKTKADKKKAEQQSVSDWIKRYNNTIEGLDAWLDSRGNGKAETDPYGGYGEAIRKLIADYDGLSKYAADYGLDDSFVKTLQEVEQKFGQQYMARRWAKDADDLQKSIRETLNGEWSGDPYGGRKEELEDLLNRYDEIRAYGNSYGVGTDVYNGMLDFQGFMDSVAELGDSTAYRDAITNSLKAESGWGKWSEAPNDADSARMRQEVYKRNQAEIERIEGELKGIAGKKGGTDGEHTGAGGRIKEADEYSAAASDEDAKLQMLRKLRGLEEENRAYERMLQGADSKYVTIDTEALNRFAEGMTAGNGRLHEGDILGEYLAADKRVIDNAALLNAQSSATVIDGFNPFDREAAAMSREDRRAAQNYLLGDRNAWNKLSQNEIALYYYLQKNQGQAAANNWLEGMTNTLQMRANEGEYEDMKDVGVGGTILLEGARLITNLTGGILASGDDALRGLLGQEIQPYNVYHKGANYAQNVTRSSEAKIQELIDPEKHPALSKAALIGYEAITSALDSALGTMLFAPLSVEVEGVGKLGKLGKFAQKIGFDKLNAYDAVMGVNAAAQRAKELWEQGATKGQIQLGAIGSGAIEAIFEHFGFGIFAENYLEQPVKNFVDYLAKTAVQGLVEGSEEFFTEVGNAVWDGIVRGTGSENEQKIREYVDQGKSEGEARFLAAKDTAIDAVWAFVGGLVSGAGMGAVSGGAAALESRRYNNAINEQAGRYIYANNMGQDLVGMAQEQEGSLQDDLLEIAMEKAGLDWLQFGDLPEKEQKKAARTMGALYRQTVDAQAKAVEAGQNPFWSRAESILEKQGAENAAAAATVLTKAEAGEQLTEEEQEIYNRVNGDAVTEKIKGEGTKNTKGDRTEKLIKTALMASPEDHPLNPKTLKYNRETVADFSQMYDNRETAEAMVANYEDGQDPYRFETAWEKAYEMGQNDVGLQNAKNAYNIRYLTEEQIEAAYEAGRKDNQNGANTVSGSQGWNDRAFAGEQGASVDESQAGAEAGRGAAEGSGGSAAGRVSAADLGIAGGSEAKTLRIRTEENYTDSDRKAIQTAQENGVECVLFEGDAITATVEVNGKPQTVRARATVQDGKMYVRADDPTFTSSQLAKHEAAHEQIRKGEIDLGQTIRGLRNRYNTQEIKAMIQRYERAYGNSGMNLREVLEEIVCDSIAEMNAFARESKKGQTAEVGVFLRNTNRAVRGQEGNTLRETSGEAAEKFSIERTINMSWGQQIKSYLKHNGKIRMNDTLVVMKQTPAYLVADGVPNLPLAIPIKKITKSQNQSNNDHNVSDEGLIALQHGMKNAIVVFDNPERNTIGFVTPIEENGGNVVAMFVKNDKFDKDTVNRASTVHTRSNINGMLNNLPANATIYVKNKNEFDKLSGKADSIPASYKSKVKFVSEERVAQESGKVKEKFSREFDSEAEYMELAQNPEEKTDIRFSREMTEVEKLEKENKLLKDRVEYWKEQTKRTKVTTADKNDVKQAARKMINIYQSQARVADIIKPMQRAADILIGQTGPGTYDAALAAAKEAAAVIVENAYIDLNAEHSEDLKALRKVMRGSPIKVTESIKADIADFADFKKRNRYNMRFREDGTGTSMDSLWLELQDIFGKGMFPDSIMNPSDQLQHVAEIMESISPVIENPYEADMETGIRRVTHDIMQTLLREDVNPNKPTKTDKAVERETRELRQLIEEGRKQERARIEKAEATELRRKIRNIGEKFNRMATSPGKADTQHAPANMLKSVVEFCETLNTSETKARKRFETNIEKRTENLMKRMNQEFVKESDKEEYARIARIQDRNDRAMAKLQKMKAAYDAMKTDGRYQMTYDETVADMMNDMMGRLTETLEKGDIWQLGNDDLNTVYQTLRAVQYTITEANKAFSMGKGKEISGIAEKMAGEMKQVNHKMPGMQATAQRYMMWQMAPDTFFDYICGHIKDNEGQVIQKAFAKGTEKMLGVQREKYELFKEFTETADKEKAAELRKLINPGKKDMVPIGMKDKAGNQIKMSRGMMMQLYMLLEQPDSFESLKFGGLSLPNTEVYYKGDIVAAYGNAEDGALISESIGSGYLDLLSKRHELQKEIDALNEEESEEKKAQIPELEQQARNLNGQMEELNQGAEQRLLNLQREIGKQLTDQEKDLIEAAHKWYDRSGEMMRDVFMTMYGFEPKLVQNYVPIHRDLASVKTDIRDMAGAEKAFNLENSGFTKERVRSYSPILLTDFFYELESQTQKMSRYVGFAQVQKDFGKIWKYRLSNDGMTLNKMVQGRFGTGKTKFGVSGEEYVNHYIADVAGGHSSDDLLGKFYGNYAAATLRSNPRVAISQAASIPTAAAVVGWDNAAKGFAKGVKNALSTQYRNDLAAKNAYFYQRYRGQGGSTELADIQAKGGLIEKAANSDIGKKLFNWCQEFDVFSTGSIMWSMAESKAQQDGMKPGTEGYEERVNEVYTDIIRKSQPNYTTTERSDILRDQRGNMKLLTMFKTQSNQNLNLLMAANGKFMRYRLDFKNGKNGVTAADVKAARKQLSNAYTSVFLGGTAFFVAIRTMVNLIMGKVNPYRDEETDEVTTAGLLKGIGKEMISSIAGMVAMGGPVSDYFMALVSGEKYYGLSDSAISAISQALENTATLYQSMVDPKKEVTGKQVWKAFNSVGTALGVPTGNAKTWYDMFTMYTRDIAGGTFGQYTTGETSKAQYKERALKYWQQGKTDKVDDAIAMLLASSTKDTDEAAKKDLIAQMKTFLKKKYEELDITDYDAEKLLDYLGADNSAAVVDKWQFDQEYEEYTKYPADTVTKFRNIEAMQIPGVTMEIIVECYATRTDGKQALVEAIQKQPITAKAKRQLWNALKDKWKDQDTPWA